MNALHEKRMQHENTEIHDVDPLVCGWIKTLHPIQLSLLRGTIVDETIVMASLSPLFHPSCLLQIGSTKNPLGTTSYHIWDHLGRVRHPDQELCPRRRPIIFGRINSNASISAYNLQRIIV